MKIEAESGALKLVPGKRLKWALALAVVADLLQVALFPFFVEGALSPLEDAVDVVMCGVLTWLVGWHWEFAPSFAVKLIPFADMAPLWTIAVANVYRKELKKSAAELSSQ